MDTKGGLRFELTYKDAWKNNNELKVSRIELFSTMMSHLDTDVKLAIMAPAGWALVEDARDLVGLHGVSQSSDPDKQK